MDLSYGAEYDDFRGETRNFLEQNRDRVPHAAAMRSEQVLEWQQLLIDNGYAARTIPKQYGGYGGEPDVLKSRVIAEEFANARVSQGLLGAPELVREEAAREQQLVA